MIPAAGPPESSEPRYTTGPLRWRAPISRHRGAGRNAALSVLAGLALLVVVVAAGGVVAGTQLDQDRRLREFVNTGPPGAPVSGGSFDVTVLGVRTAAEVTDQPGSGHDTAGVWVLVSVRVVARDEPLLITYAAARDGQGRTFLATERIDQPLIGFGGYRLEPGIPVEAEIAFEVPTEAATDLTLRLSRAFVDLRLHTVAEVLLPVDEELVAAGLAETEALLLAEPVVVFDTLLPATAAEDPP